jgi:small subunit ribosomal protein S7
MTRKKRDFSRPVLPDPKFGDIVITKTLNTIMKSGKKSVAEGHLYYAIDAVAKKLNGDPIELFHKALNNIKPLVEVRARRIGGANYQVPTEVRPERAQALAIRWLKIAANARSERTLGERLANEMADAVNNRGIAIKKREDTHRMAEANKAFAHFKW